MYYLHNHEWCFTEWKFIYIRMVPYELMILWANSEGCTQNVKIRRERKMLEEYFVHLVCRNDKYYYSVTVNLLHMRVRYSCNVGHGWKASQKGWDFRNDLMVRGDRTQKEEDDSLGSSLKNDVELWVRGRNKWEDEVLGGDKSKEASRCKVMKNLQENNLGSPEVNGIFAIDFNRVKISPTEC